MRHLFTLIQKIWLYLFITLGLVFIVIRFYKQASVIPEPSRFNLYYILFTGIFQLAFLLCISFLWKRIIFLSSSQNISLLQSFTQLATASIGKYLPGKIWGMLVRGVQMKRHGITTKGIFFATFYEQLFLLHSSIVVSGVLIALIFVRKWAFALGVLAVISLLLGGPLQRIGSHVFMLIWRKAKPETTFQSISLSLGSYDYIRLTTYYILPWLISGMIVAGLYLTFIDSHLTVKLLMIIILANTIGITVGFLALFAPGGIGVREAVSSAIMSLGMPLTDAVLLSALFRIWVVAVEILNGIPLLYYLRNTMPFHQKKIN